MTVSLLQYGENAGSLDSHSLEHSEKEKRKKEKTQKKRQKKQTS